MRSHAILFAVTALPAFLMPCSAALTGSYSFSTSQTGGVTVTPYNNASFAIPAGPSFCIGPNTNNCISTGLSGNITFSGNQVIFSFFGGTQSASGTFVLNLYGFNPAEIASVTYNSGALVTGSFNLTSFTPGSMVFTGTVDNGNFSASNGRTIVFDIVTVKPPVISKSFNPVRITPGANSTLTLNLSNPNAANAVSGVGVTDNLPAGMTIANPSGLTNTCGGAAGAVAGLTSVTLTGGSMPAGGSCSITVQVTSNEGIKNNVTGAVTHSFGSGNTASATLTAISPPVLTKTFGASNIDTRATTSLTFNLRNPNISLSLSGLAFSDTLPAGLVIATPAAITGSCGGGAITAAAGSNTVSLSGGALAAGASCTFAANVASDGSVVGTLNNTTSAVTSVEAAAGAAATASLSVLEPPVPSAGFSPARIIPESTSTLTLSFRNPNTSVPLSGVGVVDNLPGGVTVANPNNLNNTCSGTATANPGSTSVTLAGGAIPAGTTCTVSVRVTSNEGIKNNVTGAVSYTGGSGKTASATLSAISPPVLTAAFGAASIETKATTSLTFTLRNPNSTLALSALAFTDTLPAGLVVATPPAITGSCGGGVIAAAAASNAISLNGAALAAGVTCTFAVNVSSDGSTLGNLANATSVVTSAEAGAGAAASATVSVTFDPPTVSAAFTPSRIKPGANSTLTLSIKNTNTTIQLNGVGLGNTLPAGVTIASPNGLSNNCGGTVAATAGSNSITLSGGAVPAGFTCTVSLRVTSNEGVKNNVTSPVTYTGGAGGTASATLSAATPPSIINTFAALSVGNGTPTTMTFILQNPNSSVPLTGLAFTNNLPTGLVLAAADTVTGNCGGGTIVAAPGTGAITLSGAALPAGGSCTFKVNVVGDGKAVGYLKNSTGQVASAEAVLGDAAAALIFAGDPFEVRYAVNSGVVNILNTGASGAALQSGTTASITGSICANIFTFAPDEQMVGCCSCAVTPNGLASLSVRQDLLSNTLTASVPNAIVIKIVATLPVAGSCVGSAAGVETAVLAEGLKSFGSTVHAAPVAGQFAVVETPFSPATLSPGELSRLGNLCTFIQANGSGYGLCRACRLGGQGADSE